MELVNQSEIAKRTRLSRERVSQLARRDPAFPDPVAAPEALGGQKVYEWEPVRAYFEQRVVQTGRPRKTPDGNAGQPV